MKSPANADISTSFNCFFQTTNSMKPYETEDKGFEPLRGEIPPNGFRDRPLQPDLGNLPMNKIVLAAVFIFSLPIFKQIDLIKLFLLKCLIAEMIVIRKTNGRFSFKNIEHKSSAKERTVYSRLAGQNKNTPHFHIIQQNNCENNI